MFRNPRISSSHNGPVPLPSFGRPPSPVDAAVSAATSQNHMATVATPVLGRGRNANSKTPLSSRGTKGQTNGSILSFFTKSGSTNSPRTAPRSASDQDEDEESLFIGEDDVPKAAEIPYQTPTPPRDEDLKRVDSFERGAAAVNQSSTGRYNELEGSIKRRRIASDGSISPSPLVVKDIPTPTSKPAVLHYRNEIGQDHVLKTIDTASNIPEASTSQAGVETVSSHGPPPSPLPAIPNFKQEQTSASEGLDYEAMDDFTGEEFYEEGEEFLERKWMEEQALLEADFEGDEDSEESNALVRQTEIVAATMDNDMSPKTEIVPSCPICSIELTNLSDQEASLHVNNCLDGKPTPLPSKVVQEKTRDPPSLKSETSALSHKRFQRSAIARPGQQNPFTFDPSSPNTSSTGSSSAFSTLMSGHAEDAAWAAAAANEAASRGKPAYKRTCPFYKIMPGLFICVDAFRYGAVEGCNAYFLSHFHSDHYIGLTSSWCHGPIYCSRVTANLVRQQLRVDPKWVFDLEFDRTMEVPNTQGVRVTMIPANHCPGSSLYLFEKTMSRGKTPKVHRTLHCGDFRACPAHVQHPQLRPNIVDAVSKRNIGQQKLDVCYLDTTYLTPKYAFPAQEDVIQACADMCVSLSKDFVDENDSWEQTVKERAGSGMVKFVRQASSNIKQEPLNADKDDVEEVKPKKRGRLLVICGTYSIGKERICLGIAKALDSKIYAPPHKQRIVAALEDPELDARMTNDPLEAQVHMQMLMEIRAETLADYLTGYKPHFSRIVGFRPSGWNYRPPNSRFTESPLVSTILNSENWKSRYSMAELVPQRGSTRESSCFGVPYSEHSSFRELTMFCCALRIDKIIPTVNVGSAKSREKMKGWCEKWAAEKKKNGLWKVDDLQVAW